MDGKFEKLRYQYEPARILVSTAEVCSKPECRVYDVRDLLADLEPAPLQDPTDTRQWRFRWQPAGETFFDVWGYRGFIYSGEEKREVALCDFVSDRARGPYSAPYARFDRSETNLWMRDQLLFAVAPANAQHDIVILLEHLRRHPQAPRRQ